MFFILAKKLFEKLPFLRPVLRMGKKFVIKPKFSGWGMTTVHGVPWNKDSEFMESCELLKKFEFTQNVAIQKEKIHEMFWRFWVIKRAVDHSKKKIMVECGVGDGLSSWFILRNSNTETHLYDTWGSLREEDVEKFETVTIYSNLEINRTKQNLKSFSNVITWHQGYIPETLDESAPKNISLLHLDLTTEEAYMSALEFFLPRMVKKENGNMDGIIIFDDVGRSGYEELREKIKIYLSDKGGSIFELPTGQVLYY